MASGQENHCFRPHSDRLDMIGRIRNRMILHSEGIEIFERGSDCEAVIPFWAAFWTPASEDFRPRFESNLIEIFPRKNKSRL
jgi:hypothetical protein